MDKHGLSERDVCTKFITPALHHAGWDAMTQIREEVSFTKGRIIVRGKLVSRGRAKRADYLLSYKPNLPIALIEAKRMLAAHGADPRFVHEADYIVDGRMQWRTERTTTLMAAFGMGGGRARPWVPYSGTGSTVLDEAEVLQYESVVEYLLAQSAE